MTSQPTQSDVDLATEKLWDNIRLVVVDTETTGLSSTDRLLSFAAYTIEFGATTSSWSSLINPRLPTIGAVEIHGLTQRKLRDAPEFSQIASKVRELLTSHEGETVLLVGHNIVFDYERLDYEYFLLDDDLGDVLLLDTGALARAAGVASANLTLKPLAAKFGLSNPAAHEANSDALLTREVALLSIEMLAQQGQADLASLAVEGHRARFVAEPVEELSEEHEQFHAADMLTSESRNEALDGCLKLSCRKLHHRVEDCVVDAKTARQVSAWITQAMTQPDLSRFQQGLLATGYKQVLRSWREQLAKPDATVFINRAVQFLTDFDVWYECDDADDLCDLCQLEAQRDKSKDDTEGVKVRRFYCRFLTVPTQLVFVCLYDNDGEISTKNSVKFCRGTGKTMCGKTSGYAKFSTIVPNAGLTGAVAAGRSLKCQEEHDLAMDIAKTLWRKGVCSAGLTNLYSGLVEETGRQNKTVQQKAVDVCVEGIQRGGVGDWDSVVSRKKRLERRIAKQAQPPCANPKNVRQPRKPRFGS